MPANNVDSPEMAANGAGTANADPYAPTAWGSRYEDLTCPSGQTCRVRKIGIAQLVADGAIDDLDTLTKFVDQKHIEPKAKVVKKGRSGNPAVAAKQDAANSKQSVKSLLGGATPDDVKKMFRLMDQIVLAAVVAPKLQPVPLPPEERDEETLYIDGVDEIDKSFIMNYVFAGVKDLESFRQELAANAASMGNVEDLEMPSE